MLPKVKYKISQAKPTCAMLTVLVATETKLPAESRSLAVCDVRAGTHTQIHRTSLVVHVGAGVDALLGKLGKGDFETLLDRLQDGLVLGTADERDGQTLGTETTSTTDTVEV